MRNYFRPLYYLYSMLKHAYWDRSRLLEHQNKELRKIVKYSYDYVPFYHERFQKFGIKPSDIRTVTDLNRIPILRKEEIRKNLEGIISKKFYLGNLQRLSTSGSTGEPLPVFISEEEDDFRKVKHLRANIACGQKPRDHYVDITSPTHFAEVPRLLRGLGIYSTSFVSVFDDVATQISTIKKMKIDILGGYSSSLLLLAREIKKREEEAIKPRFIFGGAELLDDFSRQFIEEVFGVPLYDQYAIVELERIAWQCPAKLGYHIDADAIIVQFVDENEEDVSEGERGEIVCTSLFNYAMPFIRYSTGDIGIPSDDECPCGRALPLMKVVEGRKDSLLFLPNGRILSPRTVTIAMNMFELRSCIEKFRVIQKKMDTFEVWIKKTDNNVDEATLATKLVAHFKKMLKIEPYIKFVEDIPIDKSGKLRAVVSELEIS